MAYGNVGSSETPFGSVVGRRTAGPMLPLPTEPDWIWRNPYTPGGCRTGATNVPGVTVTACPDQTPRYTVSWPRDLRLTRFPHDAHHFGDPHH